MGHHKTPAVVMGIILSSTFALATALSAALVGLFVHWIWNAIDPSWSEASGYIIIGAIAEILGFALVGIALANLIVFSIVGHHLQNGAVYVIGIIAFVFCLILSVIYLITVWFFPIVALPAATVSLAMSTTITVLTMASHEKEESS
ncbi:hypothetical protein Pelo_9558 [Pelomyxa schiedti]|nr:hypothetical protein Pelo_9558 [Pelomyxa schiedti]